LSPEEFHNTRQTVLTASGRIAFAERGSGPAALFIHGFPVNGYHWRHQLDALGSLRRCIAPDLMGLGYSEVLPERGLEFDAQAQMLIELLDALGVDEVDLVGNDSGGAIAQMLATTIPGRIRTLTLTNCDTNGNWPPPAFIPIQQIAKAGQLGKTFTAFAANLELAQSPSGLGSVFEFPDRLTNELVNVYLGPLTASPERQAQVDRYALAIDEKLFGQLPERLKTFEKPTMIVWGDADPFFDAEGDGKWAYWLRDTIPGVNRVSILKGGKLFFPEERPEEFCRLLSEHWRADAPSM
jgi:pimeloyl-ACP methyl ester carboxylesterase